MTGLPGSQCRGMSGAGVGRNRRGVGAVFIAPRYRSLEWPDTGFGQANTTDLGRYGRWHERDALCDPCPRRPSLVMTAIRLLKAQRRLESILTLPAKPSSRAPAFAGGDVSLFGRCPLSSSFQRKLESIFDVAP
jgi:hypothetical protein